jgi:GT2 family glycosyltransferase
MTSCSLIIATYNRGPRIAKTLDSVLRQTVIPDEIVVVDDCSPDGTGAWVKQHYPMAAVVRAPRNLGTSAARNLGARAARGETLIFLDHDDELFPEAVATLLGLRRAFPQAGAFFADHTYTNYVNGVHFPNHHEAQPGFARMRGIAPMEKNACGRLYGHAMYRALLRGNLLQQPWAIEREVYHKVGGFAADVRYCEDWDMYLRVARCVPVAVTDQVISHHYVEGENLHLQPNQAAMHQRVLRRRLQHERFRDPRSAWIVRRRLGSYAKMSGDCEPGTFRAWRSYLRSFGYWPFDHVVLARLFMWPVQVCLGQRKASGR